MDTIEVLKVLRELQLKYKRIKHYEALSSAIQQLQAYEELKGRIDEIKFFNIILEQKKPFGLFGNSTGGGTMIDAYPDEYKQAQAIFAYLKGKGER